MNGLSDPVNTGYFLGRSTRAMLALLVPARPRLSVEMRLTLFGTAQLAVDPESGAAPLSAKSLALLAFLTLEPGSHSRNALSGLLWGDFATEKAQASLRQSLKQLRDTLGDHLAIDRHTVALRDNVPSDVAEFLAHAADGSECAADVDVPQFLTGLAVRDAQAFEEWADRTRQSLLQRYRRAVIAAARSAHARRDWGRALTLAERWQQLDQLSDDAAHFLVEVLYLNGERDAALAAFENFRARLTRESGTAPGLALRQLAARIHDAPFTPTPRVAPVRAQLPAFDAGLIGREREWAMLQQTWNALRDGQGGVVVVEGATGVGKSRLMNDFARFLATQDVVVLRGRAFESSLEAPFGPVLEILRSAVDAPGAGGTDSTWLAEVARVVPEMRRVFPSLPDPLRAPTADGSLLHEGVTQLLLAVAEESPVVIMLDDLHWCDASSCTLLHFLVQRLCDAPVLWCVSLTPGAAERDAPAARLARAFRAAPTATRVRLESLSHDDVWQLIRALGRVQHPDGAVRLASRVYDVTGGNPLYVVELLKTLFTRGWLAVQPDTLEWITTDRGASELNTSELLPNVRESLGERIAALPDEQHALLLTVAVTDSGCHTSLLSYVHGISRLRAAHVCDALVERGLLAEENGRYLCAHAVIASVAVESMSASRCREVHRMIALALTDAASSVGMVADPATIARHAAAGGEPTMAHRHALLANNPRVVPATLPFRRLDIDLQPGSC